MGSRTGSPNRNRRLKQRGLFNARRGDSGFSLVELMVAIVIFSIVGGIVTAALVSSNKASRVSTNSVMTQAQLVDAMTHIGRDISAGSIVPTAKVDSLEVRGVQSGHCVVSVFTASGTSLSETRTTLADTSCPATGGTASGSTPTTKTLVAGLTSTTIFAYFDDSNNDITSDITDPDNPASTNDIKRVQYTISAGVSGRTNPMVLTSSSTLNNPSALVNGGPSANCPAPVLSGTLDGTDPTVSHMNWTQPLTASGYILTRDGGAVTQPDDPTQTSFDDSNLAPGGSYLYYVYAQCNADTSAQSNGVVINTPPAAPPLTGKLYALDSDAVVNDGKLTWTPVTGATSYQLFRTGPDDSNFASVYTGANTSYPDPNLVNLKTYQYYVVAIGLGGTSAKSNIVKLTPSISPPAAPSCTASLYANDTDKQVNDGKFTWPAVASATQYDVYAQKDGATTWSNVYEGTALTYSYINKMSYGQKYNFYLTASNKGGDSDPSPTCSLTPVITATSLPGLTLTGSAPLLSQSCNLSWKWAVTPDPTLASTNKYNVYYSTTSSTAGFKLLTAQANTARTYNWTACPWGGTVYFYVTTNTSPGPTVTSNTIKLLISPGPFSIYMIGVTAAQVGAQLPHDSSTAIDNSSADNSGTMVPHWSKSSGATSYTWNFNGTTVPGAAAYTTNSDKTAFYGTPQTVAQGGYIRYAIVTAKAANGLTRVSNTMRAQSNPTTPNRIGFIQTCVTNHNVNGSAYWGLNWYMELQPWADASYSGWKDTSITYHIVVQGYGKSGAADSGSKYVSDSAGDGWLAPRDSWGGVQDYITKGSSSKWVLTVQAKAVRSTPAGVPALYNPTAYSPVVTASINSTKTDGWLVNSGAQNDCGSSSYDNNSQHNAPYNQNNYPATWDRGFTRLSHDSWATGKRTPSDGWTG